MDTLTAETWKQAFLRKSEGMLVPSQNDVDDVALLTARTLLAYLMDNNMLSYEVRHLANDQVVVVCNKDSSKDVEAPLLEDIVQRFSADRHVDAIVMCRSFEPVSEQPALAFLKPDTETIKLFNKVWLKSSLSWLKKNPQDRVVLDLIFKK